MIDKEILDRIEQLELELREVEKLLEKHDEILIELTRSKKDEQRIKN